HARRRAPRTGMHAHQVVDGGRSGRGCGAAHDCGRDQTEAEENEAEREEFHGAFLRSVWRGDPSKILAQKADKGEAFVGAPRQVVGDRTAAEAAAHPGSLWGWSWASRLGQC